MKYVISFIFLNCVGIFLYAQSSKDTSQCLCNYECNFSYPKDGERIGGTVIIEWDIDSKGFFKNAIVIQSLVKPFDDEALRVINKLGTFYNNCWRKI